MQLDIDAEAKRRAQIDPQALLAGAAPRFIDEWQVEADIWNHVRSAVDARGMPGQFILAGSSVPSDDSTRHSGAGRIQRLVMRPMSLFESGHSTGAISLAALFDGTKVDSGESALDLARLADRIAVGGWPGLQAIGTQNAQRILRSYLDDIARIDIARLDGEPRRDPVRLLAAIKALARSVGTEVSLITLAADASPSDAPMRSETVSEYLRALARVFVIEDQPSWRPHLRSRDRVRQAAKRHFVDPSLAAAALGAAPTRLLANLEYFGQLFESLVVRDLRVLSQPMEGKVAHYRDDRGREINAIIERPDSAWIGVEVKLGARQEDQAAASLTAFAAAIDHQRTPAPSALVVITGGRYGYTRPDGIHVVPIGLLGP